MNTHRRGRALTISDVTGESAAALVEPPCGRAAKYQFHSFYLKFFMNWLVVVGCVVRMRPWRSRTSCVSVMHIRRLVLGSWLWEWGLILQRFIHASQNVNILRKFFFMGIETYRENIFQLWFFNRDKSIYIQSLENFRNLRIGQYFLNTLYLTSKTPSKSLCSKLLISRFVLH